MSGIQFAQNVKIITHTLLNKIRCTANYKSCCLLNVAIPAIYVTTHYCFLPLYSPSRPLYLTLNSDKQQITLKALKADVLHTGRHSGCACIAAITAASLATAPTFGNFVFKMSL